MKSICSPRPSPVARLARWLLSLTQLVLAVLAAACAPEAQLPIRASALRSLQIAPAQDDPMVVDRQPAFTLRFDRLMNVAPDAVWLIDGAATESLRNDARRGALSSSNSGKKIDVRVQRSTDSPRDIQVEPEQPLWPGQLVTLITTARLLDDDGRVASESATDPQPVVRTFRVCSPSDCRPIARMTAPAATSVPFATRAMRVRFDRPLAPAIEGPVVWLVRDRDGEELPGVGSLDCRDGDRWRCVQFVSDEELEPESAYTIRLGALADSDGRTPSPLQFHFVTGARRAASVPDFLSPGVCAEGERSSPPLCIEVRHGAITVTTRSDFAAVLRLRAGEWAAESDLSTTLRARLAPTTAGAHVPIIATLASADGTAVRELRIEPIETPAPVASLRITEVYARPKSSASQEFVEVLNEGDSPAELGAFVLRTLTGRSALPAQQLPAGARAVIVGPAFDVRGDERAGDPPLAPGAVLVRLDRTLLQRGLNDRGADVWLEDASGATVSRAPLSHPARAPRVGVSIVRGDVRMLEDDPASWRYDAGEGATPGAPDRLR